MPLFRRPIERELIDMRLRASGPMTDLQFFARELTAWEHSPQRKEMLDGDRYYMGEHDILARKRKAIGKDGKPVEVENLPNNRIVDNQYAKHVDQKANYLLGQPISFSCDDDAYVGEVKKVLGMKFMRTLRNAGVECFNAGISWLYPYFDKTGALAFRLFPGYEILPFWADAAHTELDAALRLYPVEVYVKQEKKIIKKVDIFTLEGVETYIFENGILKPDPDSSKQSYVTVEEAGKKKALNWERFPLIPIKYNSKEIPLIRRGRSLQDAINLLQSDFVNCMEDTGSSILVLKNYDGQDLGEFRKNLATYRAVKVRTVEGTDGGVDSLEIEVNAENYKTVLDLLKKSLIENLRSYDAKDERMSGTPNQMNIQSMYCDIDLDANAMETELQAAFEEILWFVNTYLTNSGKGAFEGEITVIFNRDILINESEAIDNCAKSAGIISDETIVAQHPWIDDPATELERLKKQKEEAEAADPYRLAFEKSQQQRESPEGGGLNEE
ncbi:MAG: phage portal protein [Muribaculaceae bacterium]|nr:phage portal protein [Muribaculaceae bacterium]MCM1440365.1 phage portal protein [Roseburia sp.]